MHTFYSFNITYYEYAFHQHTFTPSEEETRRVLINYSSLSFLFSRFLLLLCKFHQSFMIFFSILKSISSFNLIVIQLDKSHLFEVGHCNWVTQALQSDRPSCGWL